MESKKEKLNNAPLTSYRVNLYLGEVERIIKIITTIPAHLAPFKTGYRSIADDFEKIIKTL